MKQHIFSLKKVIRTTTTKPEYNMETFNTDNELQIPETHRRRIKTILETYESNTARAIYVQLIGHQTRAEEYITNNGIKFAESKCKDDSTKTITATAKAIEKEQKAKLRKLVEKMVQERDSLLTTLKEAIKSNQEERAKQDLEEQRVQAEKTKADEEASQEIQIIDDVETGNATETEPGRIEEPEQDRSATPTPPPTRIRNYSAASTNSTHDLRGPQHTPNAKKRLNSKSSIEPTPKQTEEETTYGPENQSTPGPSNQSTAGPSNQSTPRSAKQSTPRSVSQSNRKKKKQKVESTCIKLIREIMVQIDAVDENSGDTSSGEE